MDLLDTNKDGHIDMTEFLVAIRVSQVSNLCSDELKFKLSGNYQNSPDYQFHNLPSDFIRDRFQFHTKTTIKRVEIDISSNL